MYIIMNDILGYSLVFIRIYIYNSTDLDIALENVYCQQLLTAF